jgi:hypothetical protein
MKEIDEVDFMEYIRAERQWHKNPLTNQSEVFIVCIAGLKNSDGCVSSTRRSL